MKSVTDETIYEFGVDRKKPEWLINKNIALVINELCRRRRRQAVRRMLPPCYAPVMGFKSRFHHIWRFDLNYKYSIQRLDLRFDWKFWDSIWQKLNRDKSAACLPTQKGMHKSSKHFCLGCNLMPKLHRTDWLTDIVYVLCTKYIVCD